MDPLSSSHNAVAVLTVTSKLLATGYFYGNAVKDFPEDIRNFVGELSSLSGILHALKAIMEPPEDSLVAASTTRLGPSTIAIVMAVPLEDCRTMLTDMLANLEKQGPRVQEVVKRLSWPLTETETKTWVEKIGHYKNIFALGLSVDEL